jgi:hypothetical protein
VFISDVYYGNEGCMTPVPGLPGFLTDNQDYQLPAVVRKRVEGWPGSRGVEG